MLHYPMHLQTACRRARRRLLSVHHRSCKPASAPCCSGEFLLLRKRFFTMTITIHHLAQSRSQRIVWVLEELGIDYEIKTYQRNPATRLAPQELIDLHPLGKSPVVTDGSVTVAESGAQLRQRILKPCKTNCSERQHFLLERRCHHRIPCSEVRHA